MLNKANPKFQKSQSALRNALRLIPLGAQTFSRSHTQFPEGHSPLFATKGKGSKIWDVDGNEYIDMLSGLNSVILGYQDPDVDSAIKDQLSKGITFSLSTELELELAALLVDLIPCAEMVRYGKNGSDCTTGAISLARHITKKERVAVCGYHGWHEWYVASTSMDGGIPLAVKELTHAFRYNDISSLEALFKKYPEEFAAIIMEPMNSDEPKDDFLQKVKDLTHKHGALFIFDEVITGFRFALGGAQELFNVTPDLAIFGKAMGNGMPISVLVGKEKYMKHIEEVFFSSTFGAESLSLAASIVTIKKLRDKKVLEYTWAYGEKLKDAVQTIIDKHDLGYVMVLRGLAPWVIISFKETPQISQNALRTFFQKEMINEGIFILSSHNITLSFDEKDFQKIKNAYEKILPKMALSLKEKNLIERLESPILEPVFTVRKG